MASVIAIPTSSAWAVPMIAARSRGRCWR